MTDTSSVPPPDFTADIKRLTYAIERLVDLLEERIPPPMPRENLPPPEAGTPAHENWLSGQWNRRDGHKHYDTPADPALARRPATRLDPWVRIDVPARDGEDDRAAPPVHP